MISRGALHSQDYWFDESMSISGDADLFLRISHDWEVKYLPIVMAQYREHASSLSATYIEKIISEHERILINLSKRYDGFFKNYKSEIRKFRKKTLLSIIIAKWKYVSGTEARKFILKSFSSGFSIFLYFFSFLPYRLVSVVNNRLRI